MKATIFVPETCHLHKLAMIRREGKEWVEVRQTGVDFEECTEQAMSYAKECNLPFLKSYETPTLLHGFATIGKEIL